MSHRLLVFRTADFGFYNFADLEHLQNQVDRRRRGSSEDPLGGVLPGFGVSSESVPLGTDNLLACRLRPHEEAQGPGVYVDAFAYARLTK